MWHDMEKLLGKIAKSAIISVWLVEPSYGQGNHWCPHLFLLWIHRMTTEDIYTLDTEGKQVDGDETGKRE